MFFFVGEFGFNTEKKNNGNKGGQNFFVGPVTVPRKCNSMSNTHLNGLAFMNAMEEPVMMRIIFAAETISGSTISLLISSVNCSKGLQERTCKKITER